MHRLATILFLGSILFASSSTAQSSTQKQVDQYLQFYYPTTGAFFYEITFDWGKYMIDTGHAIEDSVHADSRKFRGYITLRPFPKEDYSGETLYTYIVLPQGEVWRTDNADIPKTIERQEVIEEKTEYGTSTSTTTINSYLEPVVLDFLAYPDQWSQYGELFKKKRSYILKKLDR